MAEIKVNAVLKLDSSQVERVFDEVAEVLKPYNIKLKDAARIGRIIKRAIITEQENKK